MTGRLVRAPDVSWLRWIALFWVAAAVLMIWDRWDLIRWFALGDTDDNLRIAQVRALIAGQDWFDLRQYRLAPPLGADVHWSRLVDLPIAGIILALRPWFGGAVTEQAAVALAPLLPMAAALFAVALIARRLVAPAAFPIAVALLLCAHSARGMWAPLRIDHHGWQLAMLALAALALTDPKRARGGLLLGAATALSLTIGLEMLVYLAAAGGIVVLMWVREPKEAPRLAAYGASLAGGCALGFLLFASYANRAPVCDALSPVWLSAMVVAGAAAVGLAFVRLPSVWGRLACAGAAGALIAVGFALLWPDCLGRPEGVSPELERIWLSNVREARPLYRHNMQTIASIIGLPMAGLVGYGLMLWRSRRDVARFAPWLALGSLALIAASLLLWQTRAGPAAQLLSVPGAAALLYLAFTWLHRTRHWTLATAGSVIAFVLISGLTLQFAAGQLPSKPSQRMAAVGVANRKCPTLAALRPVARMAKGQVMTFVDLGPRLIAVTHHDAVAGPYHRNGDAIVDVMHFFRGDSEAARATAYRRGIDYVLICPNMSESTTYRAAAPRGFYVQLAAGKAPAWLLPVTLPRNSPYRMWRVVKR